MKMATYKIKDICDVINGRAYLQPELQKTGKYRILRVGNFFSSDRWYYSDMELTDNKYCCEGDLLFAWSASFGPKIWHGEKTIYHYHIWKMVPHEEVDKYYLYYWLRMSVDNLTAGTHGSVMAHMTKNDMENFFIDLPDKKTQEGVAAILATLDSKIECNAQINRNLEQQAQAIFKSWFVETVNPHCHVGTIADLGEVVGGSTPSKAHSEYYTEHGIAWITPKDLSMDKSKFITHGEIDITQAGLNNSSAKVMPKGTVLFSSRAPIGYIAIAAGEVCTNQGFKSVVPHVHIATPYVYFFLKENLPSIEGVATGSTFKEVSGSAMKSVPAIIPDSDTLNRFTELCVPIFTEQEKLEAESRRLATLRDTLLPRLMSGEIDVSEVEV